MTSEVAPICCAFLQLLLLKAKVAFLDTARKGAVLELGCILWQVLSAVHSNSCSVQLHVWWLIRISSHALCLAF